MKQVFVSRLNSPTRRVAQPSPLVSLGFVETPLSDLASACSHCTQTFSAVASRTFLRTNTTTVLSSLDSRFYWCNFCQFSADGKDAIVDHVIKQHRFGCKWCSFQSFCRASVLRHSFDKHQPQMNVGMNMSALCSFVEDRCSVCTHGQHTGNHGNAFSQMSALIPTDVQDTTLFKVLQLAGSAEEQVPLESFDEETHTAAKPAEELKHFIVYNSDPVFVKASSSSESPGGSFGDGKREDLTVFTHQNKLKQEQGVESTHLNEKQHVDRPITQDCEDENVLSNRHESSQLDRAAEMKPNDESDNLLKKRKMKFKGNIKAACYKETSFPHTDSGTTPKRLKVTLSNSAIRHTSHHSTENLSYTFKHVGKLHKSIGRESFSSNLCPLYFSNTDEVKESSYVMLKCPEVSEQSVCTDDGGVPMTKQVEGPSVASCSEAQPVECRGDVARESSLTKSVSGKERQARWINLGTKSSDVPSHDSQSDHVTRAQPACNLPGLGSRVTNVIKIKMTETIGSADNSEVFSSYKDTITQYPDTPFDTTERSGIKIPSTASVSTDLDSPYLKPESCGLEKNSIAPADQCPEGIESKSSRLGSKKTAVIESSAKANQCPTLIAQLLVAPSVKQYVTNMPQGSGQIQEVALLESETKRSRSSQDDLLKKKMKDVKMGLIRKQSNEIVIKALSDQERFAATSSECWKELETDQMADQRTQSGGNERRIRNTPPETRSLPELLPKSDHRCPTTCHSKIVINKASTLSRNPKIVDTGMICFDQVSTGRTYFQHSRNLGEVVKRLHKKNRETYEKVASPSKELSPRSKMRKIMKKNKR